MTEREKRDSAYGQFLKETDGIPKTGEAFSAGWIAAQAANSQLTGANTPFRTGLCTDAMCIVPWRYK